MLTVLVSICSWRLFCTDCCPLGACWPSVVRPNVLFLYEEQSGALNLSAVPSESPLLEVLLYISLFLTNYYPQSADTSSLAYDHAYGTDSSPEDISQGQTYNEKNDHLPGSPIQAVGSMLPFQMIQRTTAQTTESATYTYYEECLSQHTVKEYRTAGTWPPMQEHGCASHSDGLAQGRFIAMHQLMGSTSL